LKSGYTHEMALRLVLHAVASAAAKYGREAHALLCCSIDSYVRIFVRISDSLARVKHHASKTAVVHQCSQCESFFPQAMGEALLGEDVKDSQRFKPARVATPGEVCPECQSRLKLGGPFHAGPLYDKDFVQQCLHACEPAAAGELSGITSWKKISGLLSAIAEEHDDVVFFYRLPQLCRGLKLTPIPMKQFRGTLKGLGYRVSHFHRDLEAIKTDAPNAVVYDLMRLWSQEHPPKSQPLPDLLKKEFTLKRPIEWKSEEDAPKAKAAKIIPQAKLDAGLHKETHRGSCVVTSADTPGALQATLAMPLETIPKQTSDGESVEAATTVVCGPANIDANNSVSVR